jgi:hypothetical protein
MAIDLFGVHVLGHRLLSLLGIGSPETQREQRAKPMFAIYSDVL